MSGDFLTLIEVPVAMQKTYCPRQVFGMSDEFYGTPFFTKYCANVPCRGDIDSNRADCWSKLLGNGPFVQNSAIKATQVARCPMHFHWRLTGYARECGATPEKVQTLYASKFGNTAFCAENCGGKTQTCPNKDLFGVEYFNRNCWPKLLAELKTR